MPPVPQGLREMLKDYPEHIERLQEVLNRNMESGPSLMPFDEAIWSLEGRLETFISEARQELRVAEANGDPETIATAHKKLNLILPRNTGHLSKRLVWPQMLPDLNNPMLSEAVFDCNTHQCTRTHAL
jgi:hypothetical protein